MEKFADRIPLETIKYRSEKTRSDALTAARCRAEELTKETGRKHSFRHAEKIERTVYEVFAIDREPIELAVAPLKEAAIERAEQDALATIEHIRKELAEGDNDINAVAPYPMSSYGMKYYLDRYKYDLFHSVVKGDPDKGYQSNNGKRPYYVVIDAGRCQKFVERRKREAAEQYDEFVAKLIGKIGHVSQAILDGNHVWAHSTLTVTKLDGTIERWKTQQIVNVSKLGKHFNQWPTRKLKR